MPGPEDITPEDALAEDQEESVATGPDVIARFLKTAPASPGVYRMMDKAGDVLYVGKARSLKKRVQSYTRIGGHTNRIARMILATASMEFVTTEKESEALLLEANLIKRLKPRYNVLLRDDKSFPYILITRDHDAPQILKHRGARKRDGDYFGPFASAGAVNRTINTLQRAFLLRSCSDAVYESRTRPCLLYQIKRCSAPCTDEISLQDYDRLVAEARGFLKGRSSAVRERIQKLMEEASTELEFERAAAYRDRLQALSHVQAHRGINPQGLEEADIFAIHQEAGQNCVQVFFFRTGQNWGNRAYFPRADKSVPSDEVLESFIAQFYDATPCPRLVLLSQDLPGRALLSEALSTRTGCKVAVTAPQRGAKRDLVHHALANAREALGRRLAESASQRRLLDAMAAAFDLDEPPQRIEVYDNSHIQGAHAVGAMIVAGPEGFDKSQYRKFNIKSGDLTPGDDYGMMREVLHRRFARLLKEQGPKPETRPLDDSDPSRCADGPPQGEEEEGHHPREAPSTVSKDEQTPLWPDLVVIDGGAGQLSATYDVLDELGISSLNVAAIAKGPDRNAGRERFFMRGRAPFMLEPRDPVLYFVQRLRDEAHRFAIGSHRARRKKAASANPLDDVAGIGPARKRALLQHFGSAKAVSRAGAADLQAVDGISKQMAQSIYDFFHEN
ncbi:UvrABC system protein C [bacterium MnTg02]|nr:UvrABC system protein C [bacterium MnTg02]